MATADVKLADTRVGLQTVRDLLDTLTASLVNEDPRAKLGLHIALATAARKNVEQLLAD